MRALEEAIARQVLHGGDLPTNLLELGAVDEAALLEALAETHGLDASPPGRLTAPDRSVLAMIAGDEALRHGAFPIGMEGRTMVLATAEPLSATVEEQLASRLGVSLRQVIATAVRVRQALAEHYGVALDRRFARLVARLDGQRDPSPSTAPPASALGRAPLPVELDEPVGLPAPSFGTGVPASVRFAPPASNASTPVVAPSEEALRASSVPSTPRVPGDLEPHVPTPPTVVPALEKTPLAPVVDAGPPPAAAAGPLLRTSQPPRRSGAPPRRGARRRGPVTASMAEEELEKAETTDAVLDVFFAFAQQYFAYAALFVAHGDAAEGRDAAGAGAPRAVVERIGVPFDRPSAITTVRERRAPLVARPAPASVDDELLRSIDRASARARAGEAASFAVVPIVVRGRAVAFLLGDDGPEDAELASIGDVIAMAGLVGAALERVLVRKKLGSLRPEAAGRAKTARPTPAASRDVASAPTRAADGPSALLRAIAAGLTPAAPATTPGPEPVLRRAGDEERAPSDLDLLDEGWGAESTPPPPR